MRYIESAELREWVKENLRKTIFQKAHALAVQTGCDILVKLHDVTDIAGCQYYGTTNLKKLYRSSKLRQPGEMLVSGETGLPLMDKCVQSGDGDVSSEGVDEGGDGRLMDASYNGAVTDGTTHPMEMAETDVQTQGSQFDPSQEQAYTESGVQIKTEVVDSEQQQEQFTTPSEELDIKTDPPTDLEMSLDSDTSLNVTGSGTSGTPMISRVPTAMSSSVQRYAVPISPKPYQCSICQKTFRSIQILQKHTLTFHSRPRSTMPLSRGRGKGRGKGHGSQYFRHQQSQDDLEPKGYHCVMCNRSFRSPDILQDHVTQVHMGIVMPQQDPTSQEQTSDNTNPSLMPSQMQTTDSQETSVAGTSFPKTEGSPVPMAQFQTIESPSLDASQGSPSAFNLSAASTSSSFAQPSPGRRGTVAKCPEMANRWKWRNHYSAKPKATKPMHVSYHIMEAILLTPGPVSTRTAVNTAGPRFLRGSISNQQYESAADILQKANMGYLATTSYHGNIKKNSVFVKKDPGEAGEILSQLNLCTIGEYAKRFTGQTPKCISLKLCNELITQGFVSRDKFRFSSAQIT